MNKSKELLQEQIDNILAFLKDYQPNSKEYTDAAKNLETFYKMIGEEESKELEREDLNKDRTNQNKIRLLGIIAEGVGQVFGLFCYGHWTKMGYKFEETGSVASNTFRNFLHCVKPKK